MARDREKLHEAEVVRRRVAPYEIARRVGCHRSRGTPCVPEPCLHAIAEHRSSRRLAYISIILERIHFIVPTSDLRRIPPPKTISHRPVVPSVTARARYVGAKNQFDKSARNNWTMGNGFWWWNPS